MATAMAGVTSPKMESAMTIPVGPMMKSAVLHPHDHGVFPGRGIICAGLQHGGRCEAIGSDGRYFGLRQMLFELGNHLLPDPAAL